MLHSEKQKQTEMFIALFKFIDTHAQRNHCRKCNEQKTHVETKRNKTELNWIERKKRNIRK